MMKNVMKTLISALIVMTIFFAANRNVSAADTAENIALNQNVVVSGVEGGYNSDGSLVYPVFDPIHAVDGDKTTRISLVADDNAWLYVDLGEEYIIENVVIYFNELPNSYELQISNDSTDWQTIETRSDLEGKATAVHTFDFDTAVQARYVKYQQTQRFQHSNGQWYSGNFTEFEVYGITKEEIEKFISDVESIFGTVDETDSNKTLWTTIRSNLNELQNMVNSDVYTHPTAMMDLIKQQMFELQEINTEELESLINDNPDLSAFEESSVNEYYEALSIGKDIYGDVNSTQDDIDAAVWAIKEAKLLFQKKQATAGLTTNVTSFYSALDRAYDGNDSSAFWKYGGAEAGDWIQLTFSEPVVLSSVRLYVDNSDYLRYGELQFSADGSSFVKYVDLEAKADQTITVSPTMEVRAIRIWATQAHSDNWWKLNEIYVEYYSKSFLEYELSKDKEINPLLYTAESYQAYVAARDAAQAVYDAPEATQSNVDTQVASLRAAIQQLTLNNAQVVDFGLPVKSTYKSAVQFNGTAAASYGNVEVECSDTTDDNGEYTYTITYTPNKVLEGKDIVTLTQTDGSVFYSFNVYPATSVYYEESFAAYTGDWSDAGNQKNAKQDCQYLVDSTKNGYGYETQYANDDAGPSNGTEKISITAGNSAVFDFTGTGVDVYANCGGGSNQTGTMSVIVRERTVNGDQTSYGNIKKLVIVDTSVAGKGTATESQNDIDNAYGINVVSVDGLDNGTYTVGIRHNPTTTKTEEGEDGNIAKTYPIKLDGFRVYNTLSDDAAKDIYDLHDEADPNFIEMRNIVLNATLSTDTSSDDYADVIANQIRNQLFDYTETGNAIIVENTVTGVSTAEAKDILMNGPKNELFLSSGQSLVFGLKAGLNNVQIGLKAADTVTSVNIQTGSDTESYVIAAGTDMFYRIGDITADTTITITNIGTDGILSVTDLKYFADTASDVASFEKSLLALNEIDLVPALVTLGYQSREGNPDSGSGEEENPDSGTGDNNSEDKELPFVDVTDDDWYYDYISYVYDKGMMTGLTKDIFGPADSIVRAQFAVILHRIEGEPLVKAALDFDDVDNNTWYTEAVRWANVSQIATGYSDTKLFGTNDPITREQMAVMMYRYANYKKYDVSETADFSKFEDAAQVSGFAQEAMKWAVGTGIISGKDNGTKLDPQGNASRAECAAIIMRFDQKYGEAE